MPEVYVLGAGLTLFGRRTEGLVHLIAQAAEAALREADGVDAVVLGTMAPEEYLHGGSLASRVVDRLGLTGIPAIRVETASSSGAAAFQLGVQAVAAGTHRRVLAIGAEKMSHVTVPRSTQIMSQVLDRAERRTGLTMPAMAALVTTAYAGQHRIAWRHLQRALSAIAVKAHANGALNPYAHLRRPISHTDYHRSRLIASPLRVFDCAPISDGAAAIVLGTERSRVRVAGTGQATDRLALCERPTLAHFAATRRAAARAYEAAGFGPDAVTFAEIHDAFTPFELISMEDLGLVPIGTAVDAVLAGDTALDGRRPVNPSGGLKARGHPVGASGLAQIVEIVWQMRETVGRERRVSRADVALALSIGGPGANTFVTLLERMPAPTRMPAPVPVHRARATVVPRPSPARSGTATVVAETTLHVTSPGFPKPTRLALLECRDGARVLARLSSIRRAVRPGDRIRFSLVGDRYRGNPVDPARRLKVMVRRMLRRLPALVHRRRTATA